MNASLDGWFAVLTFATALGCGLIAGFFFAFSTFVMPGGAREPPGEVLSPESNALRLGAEARYSWVPEGWLLWVRLVGSQELTRS